jgi:hypothetical protein
LNLYAYCGDNPINATDPMGTEPIGTEVIDTEPIETYSLPLIFVDGPVRQINYGISSPVMSEIGRPFVRDVMSGQELKEGFLDYVQGGLDAGGTVEPTPFCDLASGIVSVFRGKWTDAGGSVLGMIPYVGDTAKVAKYANKLKKTEKVAAETVEFAVRAEAINLPAWKRVTIDIEHIASGHMKGGSRVSSLKTLFPEGWTRQQVENTVRQAYRTAERILSQEERVLVRGSANGITVEMWVNKATKTIETAYPVVH